jgi:drug/metabolite transporter (DMT)-like permease
MDAAIPCATHEEHYSWDIDSFHFKWNKHLAQHHTFVDCIADVNNWYFHKVILSVLSNSLMAGWKDRGCGLRSHFRQLSWIQIALAVTVMMIELGFLLMYRYGWNLSTGNLVTGVFVNIILVGLGVILVGEKVSLVNAIGVALSILGVALISYRP